MSEVTVSDFQSMPESVGADHADGRAHEDERQAKNQGETRLERYERLLKRVLGYRRVMRLDASPGGYHAGDFEAVRLHKVQEQWYACLDMALAQAERALLGMIETQRQYGGDCND